MQICFQFIFFPFNFQYQPYIPIISRGLAPPLSFVADDHSFSAKFRYGCWQGLPYLFLAVSDKTLWCLQKSVSLALFSEFCGLVHWVLGALRDSKSYILPKQTILQQMGQLIVLFLNESDMNKSPAISVFILVLSNQLVYFSF